MSLPIASNLPRLQPLLGMLGVGGDVWGRGSEFLPSSHLLPWWAEESHRCKQKMPFECHSVYLKDIFFIRMGGKFRGLQVSTVVGCRKLRPLPRDFGEMGSLGAVSSLLLGPARAIPEPHPVRGGGQPEPLRVVGVQA